MTTAVAVALLAAACGGAEQPPPPASAAATTASTRASSPDAAALCGARLEAASRAAPAPGAPLFESRRAAILGRARGEPVVWLRAPEATPAVELPANARAALAAIGSRSGSRRVGALRSHLRHDPAALRAVLLREGYLYSEDPAEARALVQGLTLADLFQEPELYLLRAATHRRLLRRNGSRPEYVYTDGAESGLPAALLLGDRVATSRDALASPLHRDLSSLKDSLGADRIVPERQDEASIVARVRFGDTWVRALLAVDGARVTLDCLEAERALGQAIAAWQREQEIPAIAIERLREAVGEAVAEALPFDRPREAPDHLTDGQLRSQWRFAYLHHREAFVHEGRTYPVFDAGGRPLPPQMCVDFVLDTYERAAGSWFRSRSEARERALGRLDFGAYGIHNRRGVLAFEAFAKATPALFEHLSLAMSERIPFSERERFFASLTGRPDPFRAGDVVAIQGLKADGLVHQHAILIEGTDPVTGFPHALADQMRRPRRRTWEDIMAEAPRRRLVFRIRPTATLLHLVAGPS